MELSNHKRLNRAFASIAVICAIFANGASPSAAQSVVAFVNDEPITGTDVTQRQRWMSRTNGFGDKMKAALTSDGIKQKFKELMIAANPRSQAEAQQAAERIKKQLIENTKARVLADGAPRKAALDAIIEDKLKLQAAKKNDVTIADKEVDENLSLRASGGKTGKIDLTGFFAQFEADGINKKTIQGIVKAQLAWRDVIRKQFGAQISSVPAETAPAKKEEDADARFDVMVLKLAVSSSSDEGKRVVEADSLRQKFTSCKELSKQATLVQAATVKSIEKVRLDALPKEVQPYIRQVSEGQMTPPVVVGSAVESYAVCKKNAVVKINAKAEEKPDARQVEYERFSKRYLQRLRDEAVIDIRGS